MLLAKDFVCLLYSKGCKKHNYSKTILIVIQLQWNNTVVTPISGVFLSFSFTALTCYWSYILAWRTFIQRWNAMSQLAVKRAGFALRLSATNIYMFKRYKRGVGGRLGQNKWRAELCGREQYVVVDGASSKTTPVVYIWCTTGIGVGTTTVPCLHQLRILSATNNWFEANNIC